MAAEQQQQEGQKTIVAFIVGLLIGGMLVWAFSGPDATAPTSDEEKTQEKSLETTSDESSSNESTDLTTNENGSSKEAATPVLQVGEGAVVIEDQKANATIALQSATYPISEGWIGVREYDNDQLGFILGVVRFSESQGLVPSDIILQRATTAGKKYAVVIYTEDGDRQFNLANDVQIDQIFDTFTAQ